MTGRSLQLSEEGKQKAQNALTDRCLTQAELAKQLNFSRETVSKFFRGQPVDRKYFVDICEDLGLEWDEVVVKKPIKTSPDKITYHTNEIDILVQEVRQKCYEKIQYQCGTMRMLDINKPIAIADIYTDVNILEDIISLQRRDIPDLLQDFNPESHEFDRFGRGKRLKRLPGLDAVSSYSNLMLLGKPGSGKTTFLQWVAIKCNLGEFQKDRVPIFIRLKDFAEDSRGYSISNIKILEYIARNFASCNIDKVSITKLMIHGKALILLDGLDEVPGEERDEVIRQIRNFIDQYFKNKFIITCRIAAQEYAFSGFTDVEVADFSQKQVETFAKKWFTAVSGNNIAEGEATARQFIEKLNQPEKYQIRELAVTPILLNLTCLVFKSKYEFPLNRSKLYEQGLEILLNKWDESRGIKRQDDTYGQLFLEQKIELLTQIAEITFEKSSYFFLKSEVEAYIEEYLCKLPNKQDKPIILKQKSKAVLKSIEVQHGLLVERAQGIYSFSHLTFHEYFTTLAVLGSFNPQDADKLFSQFTRKSWREVFLMFSSMLQNADELLILMKQRIDKLIVLDGKVQGFLEWVNQKTNSASSSSKLAATRAFYFSLGYNFAFASTQDIDFSNTFILAHKIDSNFVITPNIDQDISLTRALYVMDISIRQRAIKDIIQNNANSKIRELLQRLLNQITKENSDQLQSNFWWKNNSESWHKSLRGLMIEYFNIGHNWDFNIYQKELLKQYYDANFLLIECLNNGSRLSYKVRSTIENTLLLPITEAKKNERYI